MRIHLLFFGALREALQVDSAGQNLELPANCLLVSDLIAHLRAQGGAWDRELADAKRFRVAVNQRMGEPDTPLVSGGEVAIFSLVTGG